LKPAGRVPKSGTVTQPSGDNERLLQCWAKCRELFLRQLARSPEHRTGPKASVSDKVQPGGFGLVFVPKKMRQRPGLGACGAWVRATTI